ncbi:hypothetical protein [Actinoplanes sp. NPDC049265]|uniref:hypothetical protein n=1 Tax=Actinoplanes sp. NPDC049265 TaxID=3363902 RepID=UPI0037199BE7
MNRGIATALINLLVAVDLATDDEIEPQFAEALEEDAATAFDAMSDEERHLVAEVAAELAEDEADTERREALEEFPATYGLDDEDDD